MAVGDDEQARTLGFAEAALERIRAFGHPAEPHNYEFWFTYATGFNAELNRAVNAFIARDNTISVEEAETLYQMHVAPNVLPRKLDQMGAMVVEEIQQIVTMLHGARDSVAAYDGSLDGLGASLALIGDDPEQVRQIIHSLMLSTREMRQANVELEGKLLATEQEIASLQKTVEAILAESLTDPLTQVSNRKYFDAALEKLLIDARRGQHGFSLLVMDIDHFKTFNDTFGHLTGDQVLRLVALALKQNVKGQDIVARYGGEEFAIILPDTPLRAAVTLAEHIRRSVAGKELLKRSTGAHLGRLTVSIGVATFQDGDTTQTIVERADTCLYAAKHGGRNRVMCETDTDVVNSAAHKVA
jgi:diguanylate cyclase